MLSILRGLQMEHLTLSLNNSTNYTPFTQRKMDVFFPVCIHWLLRRMKSHTGEYNGI